MQAHTEEVKRVLGELLDEASTINFDPEAPTILETHNGPKGIAAVCLQENPADARWLPVASFSRSIEGMETLRPPLLLELTAIQEGLHRMAQVAVFSRDLRIVASAELIALQKAKMKLHPDLLWRMCDILSYNPTFLPVATGGTWLPESMAWDSSNSWDMEEDDQEMSAEFRRAAVEPARQPRRGAFLPGQYVHVAFDGGASKAGIGTAGFVIVDQHG
jgi:ribonuclease HI